MLIGDSVTHNGRTHVVIGFTPVAVIPAQVQLRDPETGETFWIEWPPVTENVERAALRVVRDTEEDQA